MVHIPIRNLEDNDGTVIYFPVPSDGELTLEDLRSGFPSLTSLRYIDVNDEKQHHILCRQNVFLEPEDGWKKEGRMYLAVNRSTMPDSSRYGLFQSYRRQICTGQQNQSTTSRSSSAKSRQSDTTMLTVGHGMFKAGKFTRISCSTLSNLGGLVVVGPFTKTGNTAQLIKNAAFEKFCQLNIVFRQKYNDCNKFILLYPDGSKVDKLPNQSEEFSIIGYRNFIDPNKRFERLRLYLCEKKNFNYNQPLEIVSASSSDEDLPQLSTPHHDNTSNTIHTTENSTEKRAENHDEDTLPLTVDIAFHYMDQSTIETFPNNTKGSVLIKYAEEWLNVSEFSIVLKASDTDYIIQTNDSLMELTSSSSFRILLEDIQQSGIAETEIPKDWIKADYFATEGDAVAENIVEQALRSLGGTTEPTAILQAYQSYFMQGRPLDLMNESETIEGETSPVCISRHALFEDILNEIKFAENIRYPIEVMFFGEYAMDLGGPRKEMLNAFMTAFKDRMLETKNGNVCLSLRNESEDLSLHRLFYSALLIGVSVIQGGPAADFLDSILEYSEENELKDQFIRGLRRTGLYKLLKDTRTVRFLFRPIPTTEALTVNQFLHIFKASFSEEGSNRRTQEENSYRQFIKYLRQVYAGRRGDISLEKILKFATGTSSIPVLGFSMNPTIYFAPDTQFPTSSTCINRLYLPLDQDDDRFDLAFANDFFGLE